MTSLVEVTPQRHGKGFVKSPSRPTTSSSSRIVEYHESGCNYGDFGSTSRPSTADGNNRNKATPDTNTSGNNNSALMGTAASPKKRMITIDHFRMDVPTDEMLKELFDYFDTDKSGYIDLSEFREFFKHHVDNFGAPMSDRDVDRLFAKFDKAGLNGIKRRTIGGDNKGVAGDGKLHFDEFSMLMLYLLRL